MLGNPVALPGGGTAYDPVHMNSLELSGATLVFSARHADAVYAVDRGTGAVVWKLGGTPSPESLAFVGDPYGGFGGQHDARILPDGTLTLHDNGTGLGRPPRAVRYRLDLAARTATLVEQITDPSVTASACCGSARRLDDGHWLVAWGSNPLVAEYAPDGTRVMELAFATGFSYRANPVPAGAVTAGQLRAAMDAMHPRP